jgi:hypothetical protein
VSGNEDVNEDVNVYEYEIIANKPDGAMTARVHAHGGQAPTPGFRKPSAHQRRPQRVWA